MVKKISWVGGIVVVIVLALFLLTERVNDSTGSAAPEKATMVDAKLDISGMVCTGCARLIKKKVQGYDGVLTVNASYPDSSVIVSFDSSKTSIDTLKNAIEKKGYLVKNIRFDN